MNEFKRKLAGFLKYRYLLSELVVRDIKVRYRRSVLGLFWTLLNPLLMMSVMTFVFSTVFKSNIPNFPVYFLTGSILFSLNAEATTQALYSIIGNGNLIKKVYVPKYLFPCSRVLSGLVNFCFSFVALLIVMAVTGADFYPTLLLAVIPVFFLLLFTTGLSLMLAAYTVFFRDLGHLYSVLIMVWTYFTPIFYPITIIPEQYRWLMYLNPMYHYIEYFRMLILEGVFPGLELHLYCGLIGVVFLGLGLLTFYKKQDKFILYI